MTSTRPWITNLRSVLEGGKFDALWLHGYASVTNLRAIALARKLGIKVLIRAESQMASAEGTGVVRQAKEIAIRRLFRKIDAFLAIGSVNRSYYRHYGVPDERIFDVPYAVDNSFFQELARDAVPHREELRAKLGLEAGRPVILFASKFIARKRAGDLLEAYALLPRVNGEPRPYLVYVGDGELRPALESRTAEIGLDSVKFLGFKNQKELPSFLDLCDVFVLASEREPWGLIVNEAMNASRPVIVTPEVGSAHDLVEDGVNGFVVPVGDVNALSTALETITSDPKVAAEMGRRSKERIDSWDYEADVKGLKRALGYALGGSTS